ncbi:MAG TPA: hypothetical protein VMC07_02360 [Candidatus Omnitrophota bacterium]|nr:hypothetical protein [Candidatus Omnitrophota bacterium]
MKRLFDISEGGKIMRSPSSDYPEIISDEKALEILSRECHPNVTKEDSASIVFIPVVGVMQRLFDINPRIYDGMCFRVGGSTLSDSQVIGMLKKDGYQSRRDGSIAYMPQREYEATRKNGKVFS